jgi:hypothetical protein
MQTFSMTSQPWQEVLDRLPPDLDLDALAFSSGALKRRREVGDGPTLLRLAMARGPGGLSLNQTAAWAAMQGLAQLSDPAVKYWLDQAVPFLKALLEQQLAERAGGPTLCWPGRSLRVVDGSQISQPGSQGSDWLVHGGYDLGGGGFFHLELTDKYGAEPLRRGAPTAGEVRIGDRDFANAKALHEFRAQSHSQADFIVRAGWKAFALSQSDGAAFDLIAHLQALPHDQQPHELAVQAKVDKTTHLPLRLIILRFSPEETAKIHKRLRRRAQRDRKTLDPRTLVAAEFLILATSLPAELYPADEVLAVYRLRWQIDIDQSWRLSRIKGCVVGSPHRRWQSAPRRRRCPDRLQIGNCGSVGQDQRRRPGAGFDRAAGQAPSLHPVVERWLWPAKFLGQFADRPFIGLSLRDRAGLARPGLDNACGNQKAAHHGSVEGVAPLRRSPGFLVEDRRDLGAAVTRPMQINGACQQRGVGAECRHPRHRADQRVDRFASAMPMAFQADLLRGVDHGQQNALQQQPHDGLTVFAGRCRRLPQSRQIRRQLPDRGEFPWPRRLRAFAPKAVMIGRQPHLLGQGFLPVPLQRARHQPVLRLGTGVAATRLVDLVLRAFQTLTPLLLQGGTLGL